MDKELLAKIENYLQDNYIDPSLIFCQNPSQRGDNAGESASPKESSIRGTEPR